MKSIIRATRRPLLRCFSSSEKGGEINFIKDHSFKSGIKTHKKDLED